MIFSKIGGKPLVATGKDIFSCKAVVPSSFQGFNTVGSGINIGFVKEDTMQLQNLPDLCFGGIKVNAKNIKQPEPCLLLFFSTSFDEIFKPTIMYSVNFCILSILEPLPFVGRYRTNQPDIRVGEPGFLGNFKITLHKLVGTTLNRHDIVVGTIPDFGFVVHAPEAGLFLVDSFGFVPVIQYGNRRIGVPLLKI